MDSAAGAVSEGVSAAAQAGAHIGHQLYTRGVSALTKGAGAAKSAAADLGDGPFGRALKQAWRPASQLRQDFDDIQQFHEAYVRNLGDAIDTSMDHYRPRFAEALTGEAGDALLNSHDANIRKWGQHQDMHTAAAKAAAQALVHINGLQGRIDSLAEAGEEEFNTAIRNRNPIAAADVWARYNGLAEESVTDTIGKATSAIQAANFTIPLDFPKSPGGGDAGQTDPGKAGKDGKTPGEKPAEDGEKSGSATPDASQTATPDGSQTTTQAVGNHDATTPGGTTPDAAQTNVTPAVASPSDGTQTPITGAPLTQIPQALGGASGGGRSGGLSGGGGGAGSGMSGLGSALKPPSGLGSSMPTSPASSMPSMPSAPSAPTAPSAASPMGDAGSSFQSGLASGMRAAGGGDAIGAMSSPMAQQAIHQQALAAQQPVMGAPAGSSPAGVPVSGGAPGPGGGMAPGGTGMGGPVGGAPMMPPAMMGGGGAAPPLAPYSAPGAGAAPAPGTAAPTAPAAASQSSSGGAGAGSGLSAPGPVVAGGSGAGGSMAGLGAAATEVSADMLLAQRVLGGLVRACEYWPAPIAWAVGVVQTPVGSQVVVASSVGGGSYLPSTVFLPSTARLAVVDPALPFGWAQRWMGCQKPSKILADHFELLSRRVAGASISAMVTTELWPQAPDGVREFLGVQHRQALGMLSVAPALDGAHQHRLTALDPVLAQRVSAVDQGGNVSAWAAAQLTAAVIQAAAQPDATGEKLVTDDEVHVLQSVHRGSADELTWKLYDELADQRHDGALVAPDSHAPLDHDGSELTEALTLWYRHYYQAGRIVELVRAWKFNPPPLAEIAYCGVQAGFGSVVTAMVTAIEQQVRGGA